MVVGGGFAAPAAAVIGSIYSAGWVDKLVREDWRAQAGIQADPRSEWGGLVGQAGGGGEEEEEEEEEAERRNERWKERWKEMEGERGGKERRGEERRGEERRGEEGGEEGGRREEREGGGGSEETREEGRGQRREKRAEGRDEKRGQRAGTREDVEGREREERREGSRRKAEFMQLVGALHLEKRSPPKQHGTFWGCNLISSITFSVATGPSTANHHPPTHTPPPSQGSPLLAHYDGQKAANCRCCRRRRLVAGKQQLLCSPSVQMQIDRQPANRLLLLHRFGRKLQLTRRHCRHNWTVCLVLSFCGIFFLFVSSFSYLCRIIFHHLLFSFTFSFPLPLLPPAPSPPLLLLLLFPFRFPFSLEISFLFSFSRFLHVFFHFLLFPRLLRWRAAG